MTSLFFDHIFFYRSAVLFSFPSAIFRKINPRKKNTACDATAMLIVPPASLTPAITAEPRKEAPFEKISYKPKYSPELSGGIILEK